MPEARNHALCQPAVPSVENCPKGSLEDVHQGSCITNAKESFGQLWTLEGKVLPRRSEKCSRHATGQSQASTLTVVSVQCHDLEALATPRDTARLQGLHVLNFKPASAPRSLAQRGISKKHQTPRIVAAEQASATLLPRPGFDAMRVVRVRMCQEPGLRLTPLLIR